MKRLACCFSLFVSAFAWSNDFPSEQEVHDTLKRFDDPSIVMQSEVLTVLDRLKPVIEEYSQSTQRLFSRYYCWNQSSDNLDDYSTYADLQLSKLWIFNDLEARFDLELCKAYFLSFSDQQNNAMELYDSVLERASNIADPLLRAKAFALRGDLHSFNGEIAKALSDFKQAQRFYDQSDIESLSQVNRAEIARALGRMADYDAAMSYLEEVIRYYENKNDVLLLAYTQLDMGVLYLDQRLFSQAIEWLDRSIELMNINTQHNEDDSLVFGLSIAHLSKAEAHANLGEITQAIENQQTAIQINPNLLELESQIQMQVVQAHIDSASGNFQQAEINFLAVLSEFEKLSNYRIQVHIYGSLINLYARQGDYEKAFYTRQEQDKVSGLYQNQLDRQASELFKIELDIAARDTELALLRMEKERNRFELASAQQARRLQLTILILTIALALTLAMYAFFKRKQTITLSQLASTDPLTGLSNRRSIEHYGELIYTQAAQQLQPVSCILIDIDHFKMVNDTYGHEVGDLVIQKISTTFTQFLRHKDRIARYGGEEFLAMLPESDINAVSQVAERIRAGIESLNFDSIQPGLKITVSIGVAERLDSELTPGGTIRRADMALYKAKKEGRNQVKLAND